MPKISELAEITSTSGSSYLYVTDYSSGSPASNKIIVENLIASFLQPFQLINEIKGFPPIVNTGDLDALNLWWDKIGTPTTAPSVFNTSACGITDNYELCLGVVADASGEGLYQRFTYADEPRVKSGRKLSTLWAIWCVGGVGVTLSLVNSDASETVATKITAAAWTLVEVPNHTLAGTYCDVKLVTDGAGTFYAIPLGANIGSRGFPLKPRGKRRVDEWNGVIVNDTDPGGAFADVDMTSLTNSITCGIFLYGMYSVNNTHKSLGIRRNGNIAPADVCELVRVISSGDYISGRGYVDLDDNQIFEYGTNADAANTEHVWLWQYAWDEWE